MSDSQAKQRLCLFGGTFDPIHNAHLRIAGEAARRYALSEVLFVPAGNPPHKAGTEITPYPHRLEMVRLACRAFPRFCASSLEAGQEMSYSIHTILAVRDTLVEDSRLFFLIGSDAFDEITTWYEWPRILQLVEFIVVARPGHSYRTPPGATVWPLNGLSMPVSSSGIRRRLELGEPTPELPEPVRRYIDQHGLYNARRLAVKELPATEPTGSPGRSTDRTRR